MAEPIQEAMAVRLGFLHAELDRGLTFTRVASTATDEDKFGRNRAKARKAYHSAFRFIGRVVLSDAESAELHLKTIRLKGELEQLESL